MKYILALAFGKPAGPASAAGVWPPDGCPWMNCASIKNVPEPG